MKLILQGQTLSLEGDDGALVRLPESVQANIDVDDPHGIRSARNLVRLSFRLADDQIIRRPENAVEVKRDTITLGEARRTQHRAYLLVFQAPPFELDHAKQPRVEGWKGTGGIRIEGPLAAAIPFVWVYNRTVEGPPPALRKLTRDERLRLFSGIWSPADRAALDRDLIAAFQPGVIVFDPHSS